MVAVSFAVPPLHAGVISIEDLLDHDPLGYECIPASFLEEPDDNTTAIAFSLTGKGRLPRTCLPNPCDRALTPRELSNITGTEMILARFSGEWDDYYARYADHCRAEVVFPNTRPKSWLERDPVLAVYDTPTVDPLGEFWPGIITRAHIVQRIGIPTGNGGRFVTNGLITQPDWGLPIRPSDATSIMIDGGTQSIRMLTSAGGSGGYNTVDPDVPDGTPPAPDGGSTSTPAPSPVTIPASGLLLAAALGLFARKHWSRKV